MIEISVIILSYNTKDITDRCVSLVKEAADASVEIIVVDNGSTDGSVEMLLKHKKIKFIDAKKNLGFAAGNNLALKQAKGKYLLLLNSDAWISSETLKKTVEYFESHPSVDVLGCRLRLTNGRMQPSAGYLPTPKNIVIWMLFLDKILRTDAVHPTRKGFFEKPRKVDWVMGAFLAMRREVWEQTSGMDENFFMYMEEVEWCWRMKQKKFSVWYVPTFEVTHLDKASSGGDVRGPLIKEMVGLSYLVQRHMPNAWWWLRPIIQVGVFVRRCGYTLVGKSKMAEVYQEIGKKI